MQEIRMQEILQAVTVLQVKLNEIATDIKEIKNEMKLINNKTNTNSIEISALQERTKDINTKEFVRTNSVISLLVAFITALVISVVGILAGRK